MSAAPRVPRSGATGQDVPGGRPVGEDPPTDAITIVVADDHAVVRNGLRLLLDREPDLHVVAEAGTVEETRRRILAYHPAILILDLNMPGESSLAAIPALREHHPETQIVVLTMQDDPGFAREALGAGALGFVLKEAAGNDLVQAVRRAARGETYLHPGLGARIAVESPVPEGPPDDLTQREADVLRLLALGHTNTEIAGMLFLSSRTIETHRASVQHKLGLGTRAELVRYALDHDLLH